MVQRIQRIKMRGSKCKGGEQYSPKRKEGRTSGKLAECWICTPSWTCPHVKLPLNQQLWLRGLCKVSAAQLADWSYKVLVLAIWIHNKTSALHSVLCLTLELEWQPVDLLSIPSTVARATVECRKRMSTGSDHSSAALWWNQHISTVQSTNQTGKLPLLRCLQNSSDSKTENRHLQHSRR